MGIKKFKQFINESKDFICRNYLISETYENLIEVSRKTLEEHIEKISFQLDCISDAMQLIEIEFEGILNGTSPQIDFSSVKYGGDLSQIKLTYEIDVPYIEHSKYEDHIEKIQEKLDDISKEIENKYFSDENMFFEIYLIEGNDDDEVMEITIRIKNISSSYLVDFCKLNGKEKEL